MLGVLGMALVLNVVLGWFLYQAYDQPLPVIDETSGLPDMSRGILMHVEGKVSFVATDEPVTLRELDARFFEAAGERQALIHVRSLVKSPGRSDRFVEEVEYDSPDDVGEIKIQPGSEAWIASDLREMSPHWRTREKYDLVKSNFVESWRSFSFGEGKGTGLGGQVRGKSSYYTRWVGATEHSDNTVIMKTTPEMFEEFTQMVNDAIDSKSLYWIGKCERPKLKCLDAFGENSVFDEWKFDDGESTGYDLDSRLIYYSAYDD